VSDFLRVAGTLVGDIHRQPDMRIKYGSFFESVGRRVDLVEVFDAGLVGVARYWNALQTFTPSIKRWKEHYFKNVHGFQMRSQRAKNHFSRIKGQVDVILQLGALFDLTETRNALPVVIYTDNTTHITARHPNLSRYPFTQDELKSWLRHETGLYERAVHICTRANIVKRSLIDDYHVPAERISVIGGGVNFAPLPENVQRTPGNEFTLLFIGTDFHRKGGDLVLRAFTWVRKINPTAQLIVVTQDAIPVGLSLDGVRVLSPIWERRQVEALYLQADVFILPSRLETWGDVLLEAMAYGLPCIGVTGQAMEDIIIHGVTGLLVDPEQIELLAHAIIQLLEQPDLRYRMGQAAAQLVAREFTWDHVVDRLFPILSTAANQVSVPSRFLN
jgi:glycosyltransferase involved in cell wall biosynthesis